MGQSIITFEEIIGPEYWVEEMDEGVVRVTNSENGKVIVFDRNPESRVHKSIHTASIARSMGFEVGVSSGIVVIDGWLWVVRDESMNLTETLQAEGFQLEFMASHEMDIAVIDGRYKLYLKLLGDKENTVNFDEGGIKHITRWLKDRIPEEMELTATANMTTTAKFDLLLEDTSKEVEVNGSITLSVPGNPDRYAVCGLMEHVQPLED